jgi:hypothetical protein
MLELQAQGTWGQGNNVHGCMEDLQPGETPVRQVRVDKAIEYDQSANDNDPCDIGLEGIDRLIGVDVNIDKDVDQSGE